MPVPASTANAQTTAARPWQHECTGCAQMRSSLHRIKSSTSCSICSKFSCRRHVQPTRLARSLPAPTHTCTHTHTHLHTHTHTHTRAHDMLAPLCLRVLPRLPTATTGTCTRVRYFVSHSCALSKTSTPIRICLLAPPDNRGVACLLAPPGSPHAAQATPLLSVLTTACRRCFHVLRGVDELAIVKKMAEILHTGAILLVITGNATADTERTLVCLVKGCARVVGARRCTWRVHLGLNAYSWNSARQCAWCV